MVIEDSIQFFKYNNVVENKRLVGERLETYIYTCIFWCIFSTFYITFRQMFLEGSIEKI